jgi:hypothetical protein
MLENFVLLTSFNFLNCHVPLFWALLAAVKAPTFLKRADAGAMDHLILTDASGYTQVWAGLSSPTV